MKSRDKRTKAKRKKKLEKKLLSIEREIKDLLVEERKLRFRRLGKPQKKGYKKSFRLKKMYLKDPEAENLIKVLSMVNDTTYCVHEDFKRYPFYHKMIHEPRYRMIDYKTYDLLPEELKKYFVLDKEIYTYNYLWKYYRLNNKEYYETYVSPHIVTHETVKNIELRNRIKKLNNYIDQNGLRGPINHLKGIATTGGKNRRNNIKNKKYLTDRYLKRYIYEFANFID